MEIKHLLAYTDNYIWYSEKNGEFFVIDPGQAEPVINLIEETGWKLTDILITHYHYDHSDGVEKLKELYPDITVYGSFEVSELADQVVEDGDEFSVLGFTVKALSTPGHTEGHTSYLVEGNVFTGDALFMAGCGRVFTGDYEKMYQTMQTYYNLPAETKVYAGHEYSLSNLEFGLSVEPDNPAIIEAIDLVKNRLAQGKPSMPSTIKGEREYNVLMKAEDLETFIDLRNKKDEF